MTSVGTSIELGRAIQEARLQAGLTQGDLARKAAVSRRWLIEVERGHDNAQLGKVLHLLRVVGLGLDVEPAELPDNDELDDWIESEFT